jgi:hypothetical protein
MGSLGRIFCGRHFGVTVLLASMVALGSFSSTASASAHGNGETTAGYLLVQQALGHLAHNTTSTGIMLAIEKIDDALKTMDQAGVDVAQLKQAKASLEAGQVTQGQALLQLSISQAMNHVKPAIGEQTGTMIVLNPLPGRNGFTAVDWGFLIVSILLLLLGVALAWRFRPPENVRELRQRFDPPIRMQAVTQPHVSSEDAS